MRGHFMRSQRARSSCLLFSRSSGTRVCVCQRIENNCDAIVVVESESLAEVGLSADNETRRRFETMSFLSSGTST